MAKKALLDVLEQTIGKYVRNLDAESLNVAIWGGKIELHHLELDVDAVNAALDRQAAEAPNLAVPLHVRQGSFASFTLDVPWAHLMSRPVVARAKGLHVTMEPYRHQDDLLNTDETVQARTRKVQAARASSLQEANDYRQNAAALRNLAEQDLEEHEKADNKNNNTSFAARLVRRIIENMQIEIRDVHVTVQGDGGGNGGCTAGVVLEALHLATTDANGRVTFVDRTSSNDTFLHKALQIHGLGVYLDDEKKTTYALSSIQEDSAIDDPQHAYVLAPLSFESKLVQADTNKCIDFPKYLLESELTALNILLSKAQLELTQRLQTQMGSGMATSAPLFPEYRPLRRVSRHDRGAAREWWAYAVRCIGRLNGRRSWIEFYRAFQKRKAYIPLYKRHAHSAHCAWIQALSDAEKAQLSELDHDRAITVEGIMAWRNIADAQVAKERTKREASLPKASIFTSLFGYGSSSKASGADAAPVELSAEEMKELESITLNQVADTEEISADSRLCDVNFVLGAFNVRLFTYDLRPLANWNMGTVSTSFVANANGSYKFTSSLAFLEIEDKITPNTLFPYILRNQHGTSQDDKPALTVRLSKSKSGDQDLAVQLRTFELVASPVLIKELKNFASSIPSASARAKMNANPMLQQSMSGSVDLFYDANEGGASTVQRRQSRNQSSRSQDIGGGGSGAGASGGGTADISATLIETWRQKTQSKAKWVADIDMQAPVIVVPETCVDPRANIVVFDLGHLIFRYGSIDTAASVQQWLEEHPRPGVSEGNSVLDNGALEISRMTFVIGKANYWRRLVEKQERHDTINEEDEILQPLSLSVNFGIESVQSSDIPRVGVFGILPGISMSISPLQLSKLMGISNAWSRLYNDLNPAANDDAHHDAGDDLSVSSSNSRKQQFYDRARDSGAAFFSVLQDSYAEQAFSTLHCSFVLQRMSVRVLTEAGVGMEAHLVSVATSLSSMSDGLLKARLKMGWFWILDRFESRFFRRQRLLVHSRLPKSADDFAVDEKYDVLNVLDEQGVFADDFAGSSDLADVSILSLSKGFGNNDPFEKNCDLRSNRCSVETIADCTFSYLALNFNPQAAKTMLSMLSKFTAYLGDASASSEAGTIIHGTTRPSDENGVPIQLSKEHGRCKADVLIRAKMEELQLCLRSALDDLPLFTLAMAESSVDIVLGHDTRLLASLGDLHIATPSLGTTLPEYSVVLGLAPDSKESLLTLEYLSGREAVSARRNETDEDDLEAYAYVSISPMRIVYLHAQIMSLVDYTTDGILGAITAQAASTVAGAAKDAAVASSGKKLYIVQGKGLQVVVPQRADKKENICLRSQSSNVRYLAMPEPGGGTAKLNLSEVLIDDMQEMPVSLSAIVRLAPPEVGSKEDQAMRVEMRFTNAEFVITPSAYNLVLSVVNENIGDDDIHLRNTAAATSNARLESARDEEEINLNLFSHAGVTVVDVESRIYVDVEFPELAIRLNDSDDDPILLFAASKTSINVGLLADEDSKYCKFGCKGLICEDVRPESAGRQYRHLVEQEPSSGEESREIVRFCYESSGDGWTQLAVGLNSPRLVFIPDVIQQSLQFFALNDSSDSFEAIDEQGASRAIRATEVENSILHEDATGIEVEPGTRVEPAAANPTTTTLELIADCSIVFVDLGSDTAVFGSMYGSRSATEVFVLKGAFRSDVVIEDNSAARDSSVELRLDVDGFEAFTAFGVELNSPVQILDPVKATLYAYDKKQGDTRSLDVRIAATTSVDMCCSIRNYALLSTILLSGGECFVSDTSPVDSEIPRELTDGERQDLDRLVAALENENEEDSVGTRRSNISVNSTRTGSSVQLATMETTYTVKMTMPSANVVVVNDLQGLDEALLRLGVENAVANGKIHAKTTTFDFNVHAALTADYFDVAIMRWRPLLEKPWELSAKAGRGSGRRSSRRCTSTFDVESFPCYVSMSEQFLTNLAAANTMYSLYADAVQSAQDAVSRTVQSKQLRRSVAASTARAFISSQPYAVDNHCGVKFDFSVGSDSTIRRCGVGEIAYFSFEPPKGNGFGGKRLYGQDVISTKKVIIYLGAEKIEIDGVDDAGPLPRAHTVFDNMVLFAFVRREGKTTIIHMSSGVDVVNETPFDFSISTKNGMKSESAGLCRTRRLGSSITGLQIQKSDSSARKSSGFGLPIHLISDFRREWRQQGRSVLALSLSTELPGGEFATGGLRLEPDKKMFGGNTKEITTCFDTICRSQDQNTRTDPLVVQVAITIALSGEHPVVSIALQPRASLRNMLPIDLLVKTPMPHTYSKSQNHDSDGKYIVHQLKPEESVEVFTPGSSIAISLKCAESPVGGSDTGWMAGDWVDLPLVDEFQIGHEPIRAIFPFVRRRDDGGVGSLAGGMEFFLVEGHAALLQLGENKKSSEVTIQRHTARRRDTSQKLDRDRRRFVATICNFSVDHVGDCLLEPVADMQSIRQSFQSMPESAYPFGAFRSRAHTGRITPLPRDQIPLRLLHLTMEGDDGLRKTAPFTVEDIAICNGGVDATPMSWADGTPAGIFVYRKLLNEHQSEIHIVPEYIVYNGSKSVDVRIRQPGLLEANVKRCTIYPLRTQTNATAVLSLEYEIIGGRTSPIRVDSLGLRICVVKTRDGSTIGSVAVQTVVGSQDSRLVVKIGELKLGRDAAPALSHQAKDGLFANDFLRARIQWSELRITLLEARPTGDSSHAFFETALDRIKEAGSPGTFKNEDTWVAARSRLSEEGRAVETPRSNGPREKICSILLYRFTVDWQRVFKEDGTLPATGAASLHSPERSQLSIIVHNVQLRDDTPNSPFPLVFDSTSATSFFDLCVRFRGPVNAELVKIDLLDLNLAHNNKVSERIIVNTSEDFIWKLLDISNRILIAASEFAGVDIQLRPDEEHGGFVVSLNDKQLSYVDGTAKYTPPDSEKIYSIAKVKVSPFTLLVSFKRTPQASRYQRLSGVRGAALMNYFTARLKFTIDRAELKFSRYEASNIKGPLDRLVEILSTVYASRIKMKLVTILTAASFQDWKFLAARDVGDDEFVEGDILRVTGNLAGNSAHYVLRKAGVGIGSGLTTATRNLGASIEHASDAVGARAVGAGVNSVVSGLGAGAGSAVSGVGSGAGSMLRGTGQGMGQAFGGITGGAQLMGKGLVRGLKHGDGRAVTSGISQGLASVGNGVGQGVESVVTGTAEGVLSVGQGVFSGFRSIGKGVSGAFSEWCCSPCCGGGRADETPRPGPLESPLLQEQHRTAHGDESEDEEREYHTII